MNIIIKHLINFVLFNLTLLGYAQHEIRGKIIESDSNISIDSVQITNLNTRIISISNKEGDFEVTEEGIYEFKKEGYLNKTLSLKANEFYIIQFNINLSQLNTVLVNSYNIPKQLKKATTSIGLVTTKDIQRSNNTDFAPILNRVPGVFMQNGALNTNRITIRGIGSRNLFGTSKIRAYFKDIPLTNGSGETTIEDFELASISQFEIIKGAGSSIYGAGLGGVIYIKPHNALFNQTRLNSEISIGSFGLVKGIVNVNHGTNKNSFSLTQSNTESDGYRENNNYKRQTLTLNTNHYLDDNNELSFFGSYVDLKAYIPSSIDKKTFLNNPKSAAFTWKEAQGYESSKRGIFGVSWNHTYSNKLKQITSLFTSFRNAYEPRPFNILKENTSAIGIRTRLLGNSNIFNKNLKWTFGGEFFNDIHRYKTFENLYQEYPSGTGSVQGLPLSNFKENRNYFNVFADSDFEVSKKTNISIGLNLNKTSYCLEDYFPVSNTNPDQSGNFQFNYIISPKLGVSYLISKTISAYSNISHGFSPISLNETLLPDGNINTDLKPETGWNFEIGTRGTAINNKLQFNASIYRLNVKNLLVAQRTAQDEYIGINAGKTQHDGIELALKYFWLQKENMTISSFTNYTLNHFIFKEFIDDTNDYSGNDLTGVPSDIFNAGVDFNFGFGLYGNINYQYVGSMPITDSNSLYSGSYNLTNLKIGYQSNLNKTLKLSIFLGINNIFDTHYASQILINASSFGNNAPRYYYPGNAVNYFSGININYTF